MCPVRASASGASRQDPGSRADDWRTSEQNTPFRSAREDDNVGFSSAIRASGASHQTPDRAPTIGGRASRTRLFVLRERTTTSDSRARSARAERAIRPRIARRRLEDERAEHAFSFCERGRQRRILERDPRERSEPSDPGSRADDWRTSEQNTPFRSAREDDNVGPLERDPRERSEPSDPGSRADDWRTSEQNTPFRSAREDDNVGPLERDPRGRSEPSDPGSRADDWRTSEQNTPFRSAREDDNVGPLERDPRERSEPLNIALVAISESLLSEDTGSRVRWNEP